MRLLTPIAWPAGGAGDKGRAVSVVAMVAETCGPDHAQGRIGWPCSSSKSQRSAEAVVFPKPMPPGDHLMVDWPPWLLCLC